MAVMKYIHQRDIILLTFDPSLGYEIQKRRPALVVSRNEYNKYSKLKIVCPITSTKKEHPFLRPILKTIPNNALNKKSYVNISQIYSLDCNVRNAKIIGHLPVADFLNIGQYILQDFNFPF